MTVEEQIEAYIAAQPEPKSGELRALHELSLRVSPDAHLWFLDGRDESGKVVTNPNIGYGWLTMHLAGGKTREFYRIGLSANTTGISLYVMGVDDKKYLSRTYGETLGKASISGYCIKFRNLKDIDLGVFEDVVRFGLSDRT